MTFRNRIAAHCWPAAPVRAGTRQTEHLRRKGLMGPMAIFSDRTEGTLKWAAMEKRGFNG